MHFSIQLHGDGARRALQFNRHHFAVRIGEVSLLCVNPLPTSREILALDPKLKCVYWEASSSLTLTFEMYLRLDLSCRGPIAIDPSAGVEFFIAHHEPG
ncbi:MAG: hypothetical protein WAK33_24450, partial [Silvibacterium sp.]